MIKRLAVLLLLFTALQAGASAQLEWDKPKAGRPIPNPSSINTNRDEISRIVQEILARNGIPVKVENMDDNRGTVTIVTEPVVFARGIVAQTQLRHFAEVGASEVTDITRGRVSLRIEVSPASPTSTIVGVYGTFEGFAQGTIPKWVPTQSKGILEDKFLKQVVMLALGTTFDDLEPDDSLLEVNDAAP